MKATLLSVPLLILVAGLQRMDGSLADQDKLAAANNEFAFNLLKRLAKDRPAANIFVSPYSVATVFQVVGNGAAGQTKTELQEVLGTTGLPDAAVNQADKEIAKSLNHDNTDVILTTANSVWYREGIPVKSSFADANQQFFQATVKALDFENRPAAEAEINRWASDQTHGRITGIADGLIQGDTALVLANAVYFKGKWLKTFDKKLTKPRPFYSTSGANKKVPMMEMLSDFAYREGPDCQVVRLPYKGRTLAMYIFLPNQGIGLARFVHIINGANWRRIGIPGYKNPYTGATLFGGIPGRVVLPKFKFEDDILLNAPLEALGIRSAFEPGKANFSEISNIPIWISKVRQKTFVEVDEEGTEAAATTVVRGTYGTQHERPPKPFQMIVDRPFLFLIEDSQTGVILFMGVMFDPRVD